MNKSQREAIALIEAGHDGEELVHFSYEDAPEDGISSPLTPEDVAKGGYLNDYYTLASVADSDSWED